jgi:acylphosphatase
MPAISRHVLISGRVQGVSFRYFTRRQAIGNGVTGWVRNLPDGRVEAVLEGESQAVAATLAWCHHGPEISRVDLVEIEEREYTGSFKDFSIR